MYKIESIKVQMVVNGKKVICGLDIEDSINNYEDLRDVICEHLISIASDLDDKIYCDVPSFDMYSDGDDYE